MANSAATRSDVATDVMALSAPLWRACNSAASLPFQQLEKHDFAFGDGGFPAFRAGPAWYGATTGMMICEDRRWPETRRVLGLRGGGTG